MKKTLGEQLVEPWIRKYFVTDLWKPASTEGFSMGAKVPRQVCEKCYQKQGACKPCSSPGVQVFHGTPRPKSWDKISDSLIKADILALEKMDKVAAGRVDLEMNDDYVVIKKREPSNHELPVNWPEVFESPKRPIFDLPEKKGATCVKCRQDYPYAENKSGFVCWSCRNGW